MSGTSDIDGNDQFRSSFLPVEAAGPSIARPAANLIITKQSIRHAKDDDMYAQGKILAYTDVTRMLLEACLADYAEGTDNNE